MPDQTSPTTPDQTAPAPVSREEVVELVERVTREVPQIETLTLTPGQAGEVVINLIRIQKNQRRQQYGNRVFDLLTEWADQRGVVLTLTVDPMSLPGERRVGKQTLRDWFWKRGFQFNIGRYARHQYREGMYRDPGTDRR